MSRGAGQGNSSTHGRGLRQVSEPGGVMVGGRGRNRRLRLTVLTAVLLAAAGGVALAARHDSTSPPPPSDEELAAQTAGAFLHAWEAQDWQALQRLVADPSDPSQGAPAGQESRLDAAGVHEQANRALRIRAARFVAGPPVVDGDTATVPFDATWVLDGLGEYSYRSAVRLQRSGRADTGDATGPRWRVRWWYTTVHPDLGPEARFERVRVYRPRAPILAADGSPLVTTVETVVVGVLPGRVSDPGRLLAALADTGAADPQLAQRLLARPDLEPHRFYPLGELGRARFDELRDRLYPVPGLAFRDRRARSQAFPGLAPALLGRTGEITAELLERLGSAYRPGDVVGRSGLELAFEQRLAGEPEEEARIVDDAGLVRSLRYREGRHPQALRTRLDPRVQQAAEAALAQVAAPAALVAIDPATGAVRAAASSPPEGFNRALAGRYPPGSTFKIVTAAAALRAGATPDSGVDCPPLTVVGGREIRNAGGDGPGPLSLAEAFARSCNTAFARLGADLGAEALTATAEGLGFNSDVELGLPAAGGSFPPPADAAEVAAAAIGQGRVEASPVHMASVAAAVVSGTWRPATLVDDGAAATSQPLPAGVAATLGALMRRVVESGTGTAAALPGEPVGGKTGSAQFGSGVPLPTHAWFVGFRGPLALAVVVEGGGAGGTVAAPVARDFLARLGG